MKFNLPIICLVLAIFFASCYKDKGNYNYTTINELSVSDTTTASPIAITIGDSLKIKPQISQTLIQNEDSLAFEWKVWDNTASSSLAAPRVVISNDRNLAIKVNDPPFSLGQNYRMQLTVTDKRTGVSKVMFRNLSIVNKYASGWLILEEKNGKGDLSMILPNGTVESGIYTTLNPNFPITKPLKLEMSKLQVTDDISVPSRRIYLLYENGGLELNFQTMVRKFDYSFLFYSAPSVIKPARMTWMSTSGSLPSQGIVINNGLVHSNMVGGFPGSKKWGEPLISAPNNNYNYSATPFVAGGNTYAVAVYDQQGKRFYNVGLNSMTDFPAAASTVFNMNNVGLDMMKMDSANATFTYNAVMKDATAPYLLQFKLTSTPAAPALTQLKMQMNAPGIMNATAIASSRNSPHVFYVNGSTLSRFEITSNTTVDKYTFPSGETVTDMHFSNYPSLPNQSQLIAATWDGAQGRLYFLTVSITGEVTFNKMYSGFGRIIDFELK